ncbi:TPA: hypothetical protein ACP32N_005025 [Pseudomonas aeruginosa]
MSFNRENVIWQSKDGTWNRAFYEFWEDDTGDDDFDPEWDVTYGEDFNWVSTGHLTLEAAEETWSGSNPGGWNEFYFNTQNATTCDLLDQKAQAFKAERKR